MKVSDFIHILNSFDWRIYDFEISKNLLNEELPFDFKVLFNEKKIYLNL